MPRLHRSRHAVPAILVTAASLAAPLFFGGADAGVAGMAGSATARAAQHSPVQAPSQRFAVGSPAFNSARDIAQAHWGTSPCSGSVDIAWVSLDPDTNATAAWRNPTDAWNNPSQNFDCRIEFNANADYDWPKLCTVMTHEMGHLVGQPHDQNPGQLMSPIYTDPIGVCTGPEPGGPAAAPPAPGSGLVTEDESWAERAFDDEPAAAKKKPAARKKTTKRTLRKAKRTKRRCTRVFRAGRKTFRCKWLKRRTGRYARVRVRR